MKSRTNQIKLAALDMDALLLSGAQRMIMSAIANIRQTQSLSPAAQLALIDSLLAAADLECGSITNAIANIEAVKKELQ